MTTTTSEIMSDNSSSFGFSLMVNNESMRNIQTDGSSDTEASGWSFFSATPLTIGEAWGWAILFVTFINLSSVVGIIFFPLMKKSYYTVIMRSMIGLAIGSLNGSALFHLIPAAFDLEETNSKGQRFVHIAAFIWFAMWIIMLLECTIKIVVKMRAAKAAKKYKSKNAQLRAKNNNQVSDEHFPKNSHSNVSNGDAIVEDEEIDSEEELEISRSVHSIKTSLSQIPIYHSTFSLNKRAIEALGEEEMQGPEAIKTVAWLIIIGDSLHNFIDGVSIGAGFVKDFRTGAIISLAIVCEEFPHEIGDFAILINSGFSVKKALLANFLSATTCYLGMALGILLGEIEWANYIFAFAAGIFLYVSLADMIPEITNMIEEVSEIAPQNAWKVLLSHNIGILLGITILYMLAIFQPQ